MNIALQVNRYHLPSFFLYCSVAPSLSLPFYLLPTIPFTFNVSMAMTAKEKIKYALCISSFFLHKILEDGKGREISHIP